MRVMQNRPRVTWIFRGDLRAFRQFDSLITQFRAIRENERGMWGALIKVKYKYVLPLVNTEQSILQFIKLMSIH